MRKETKVKLGGRRIPSQFVTARAPCACGRGGAHPVSITLAQDDCLLSIDCGCDLKMGDAVDRLGGDSCAILALELWKGVIGRKASYPDKGDAFALLNQAWLNGKRYAEAAARKHKNSDTDESLYPGWSAEGWTLERRMALMDRGGSAAAGFPVKFVIDPSGLTTMFIEGAHPSVATKGKGGRWTYDEMKIADLAKRSDPFIVDPSTRRHSYSKHYNICCSACALNLRDKKGSAHVRLVSHQQAVIAGVRRALAVVMSRRDKGGNHA
ncbi:hypothetical protein LCGC14_0750170 [marine sediment metagenome]|uniref:Uncharacterized protein n=1 Tax=marine sediment metagenome TaxID=412755 RepID=A0A0F9Q8D2_9ZZZZ